MYSPTCRHMTPEASQKTGRNNGTVIELKAYPLSLPRPLFEKLLIARQSLYATEGVP